MATGGTIAVLAVLALPHFFSADLSQPYSQRDAGFSTSESCIDCHQEEYDYWERTYHRRMAEEATAETVMGHFDGEAVTYWGVTVKPVQRGERYFFQYFSPETGEMIQELRVLRTSGSNRYQQYFTRLPESKGTYYRLHLAWQIRDQRWIHMNGAFLGPDDQSFDANVSVWNNNCIFCHTAAPVPGILNLDELKARARDGELINIQAESYYDSEVAELGITCENCHGPGDVHVEKNQNPLRRYVLEFTDLSDPTIINPEKLERDRATHVCAQCHGQRVPHNNRIMTDWLESGPDYRPGDDLLTWVKPVGPETNIPGSDAHGHFKDRFWADGTPRLSAYEYQGLLQSACHRDGEMTCMNCHTMHEGDLHGMITDQNRGNAPCLKCHGKYATDPKEHTGHEPESSGSLCYNCHMPKLVYGVMDIHRSHRIENPDPAANAAAGRPDACTNCHLDRSVVWAAAATAEIWGGELPEHITRLDGADPELSGVVASLLAGDPAQRAIAAQLASRDDTPLTIEERAFLVPHLLIAMADHYPAVRRFAVQSAERLESGLMVNEQGIGIMEQLGVYDFLKSSQQQQSELVNLLRSWDQSGTTFPVPEGTVLNPDSSINLARAEALSRLALARSKAINIGE